MNKIGLPTYFSNGEEYLIVSVDDIEGGNLLPLDINFTWEQFQPVIKSVKFWYYNNDILNNVTPQVFTPSRRECQ